MKNLFLLLLLPTSLFAQFPDYNELQNWAAHPWKRDNSDRLPKDLQKNTLRDSVVDVFFVHPTTYFGFKNGWNALPGNDEVNKRTDEKPVLYQASVFNEQARVFAPRYRQASYSAYFTDKKDSAKIAFDTAYEDVKTAFLFYLEHWNNNRPFIIASHSQGTQHAGRLLKELVENTPLQNRLVMAYLIGMPVHSDYFTYLQPCTDSTQTGCFVSWRTYIRDYEGEPYIAEETKNVIVTNPLTWKIDSVYAPRKLNKGGILYNFDKVIPHLTDAQTHGNILWARRPKKFGSFLIRLKNYHIADYNLFYMNIREDVRRRIGYFWKQ